MYKQVKKELGSKNCSKANFYTVYVLIFIIEGTCWSASYLHASRSTRAGSLS